MSQAETKALRLLQIEMLLLAHPEGMTQAQIARKLGVHRSTVHRYLPDLTQHSAVYEDEGRLFINRGAHLINMQLNLHEAMAILLAVRLLTTRMERHNPHAAAAIRKLAERIEPVSSQISGHLRLSADLMDDVLRYQDPRYMEVLETLTLAWAEGRVVDVWHRHTGTGQVYQYAFEPYFLEPYAVGQSIHAVGLRRPPGEIRTFNLARIERVEITRDYYRIPEEFDPAELLAQAWGIWYGEGDSQMVKLAFSPAVAGRVGETQWHPSQKVTQRSDGWLVWTAEIAEPKEMLPWIRGWGADVEVLEPGWVRSFIQEEIEAMQLLYHPQERPRFLELWAKADRERKTHWHPLLWHMLDTSAVVKALWQECLADSLKETLGKNFGLSAEEMGDLIAFWVGLHDIGKAGPAFQKKIKHRKNHLEKLGFVFPKDPFNNAPGFHATATTLILKRIWRKDTSIPRIFRIDLSKTLGGHHGEFPSDLDLQSRRVERLHVGDESWQDVQQILFKQFAECLNPPEPQEYPDQKVQSNPVFMLIAGLTTAADWIASNEDHFPFFNVGISPEEYFKDACTKAQAALAVLGWSGWKADNKPFAFRELFPDFTPNPIQQSIIEISKGLQTPFLVIIEAHTGSGKTEAAIFLADTFLQQDHKAGIYFAMPTQATSNQMYTRAQEFLSKRYSDEAVNLHLVHGAALLSYQDGEYFPSNIWGDTDAENSNIHSHTWFLPRKRTLLAPFGVGTVDQTFLSVLRSRHFFLRLFGLSHKIVVFDEVHAYDVYMTEIFKSLLQWLRAVGTSVIILSATLPVATRYELLQAYGARELKATEPDFPRISTVSGPAPRFFKAGAVPSREIWLDWIGLGETEIAHVLKEKLSNGGCAAVVCNRINRAQTVYDAIREVFEGDDLVQIILFHSRFPHRWRRDIEAQVLSTFGKDTSQRAAKAIVVATQVIEQSLDLDFDLMVSDVAPVDLLIQRIGRLHRHQDRENPPVRPPGLENPHFILSAPPFNKDTDLPEFGNDSYIYANYILSRTLLILHGRKSLLLPKETDLLVNTVYSPDCSEDISDTVREKLQRQYQEMRIRQEESSENARNYLIPDVSQTILGCLQSSFSDGTSSISKQILTAPTREITPSIEIVCLLREDDGIHVLGDAEVIDLDQPLTRDKLRYCLQAAVSINRWEVIRFFLDRRDERPPAFKNQSALWDHYPVVFTDGVYVGETFSLHLDRSWGVRVLTNDQERS